MSVKVPCDLSHILTSISITPTDQFPHPWKSLLASLLLTLRAAAGVRLMLAMALWQRVARPLLDFCIRHLSCVPASAADGGGVIDR